MRKTLVPPQGRIKTPYVPGLNRCSCGVTPFAVPSLPPCTCRASITGTDSPYSPGCPWARGAVTARCHARSFWGRGWAQGWTGQRVKSKTPLLPWSCTRPLSFLCRGFCYAITFILGTGGKRGFKILLNSSWVFFSDFFALWWVAEGSVRCRRGGKVFFLPKNTSQPAGLCLADCSVPWPGWQGEVWEMLLHGLCRNDDLLFQIFSQLMGLWTQFSL